MDPYFIYQGNPEEAVPQSDNLVCHIVADEAKNCFTLQGWKAGQSQYEVNDLTKSAVVAHLADLCVNGDTPYVIFLSHDTVKLLNPELDKWYDKLLITSRIVRRSGQSGDGSSP